MKGCQAPSEARRASDDLPKEGAERERSEILAPKAAKSSKPRKARFQ